MVFLKFSQSWLPTPQVLYLGGCFIDQRKGSSVCSAPGSQVFQGETVGTGRTEASGAGCIELSFKASFVL